MNVTHNTMRQSECAMICRYVATLLFNDQLNQSENGVIHHVHVVGGNALAHECMPIQILNLLGAKNFMKSSQHTILRAYHAMPRRNHDFHEHKLKCLFRLSIIQFGSLVIAYVFSVSYA